MRRRIVLAALPLLAATAFPPDSETRFEARGEPPDWTLAVARNTVELKLGEDEYKGRVASVERSPGHMQLSATVTNRHAYPMAGGRPLVDESKYVLEIEVAEEACTSAAGQVFATRVAVAGALLDARQGCGASLAALEAGLKK